MEFVLFFPLKASLQYSKVSCDSQNLHLCTNNLLFNQQNEALQYKIRWLIFLMERIKVKKFLFSFILKESSSSIYKSALHSFIKEMFPKDIIWIKVSHTLLTSPLGMLSASLLKLLNLMVNSKICSKHL